MSGLRRFDTNNHLLKTLPSKDRVAKVRHETRAPENSSAVSKRKASSQDKPLRQKPESTRTTLPRIREPKSIEAPPLSSDSESEGPTSSSKIERRSDAYLSSSPAGGERGDSPDRADIIPTLFRNPSKAKSYSSSASKSLSSSRDDDDRVKKRKREASSNGESIKEVSLLPGAARAKIYSNPSFPRRPKGSPSREPAKEKKLKGRIKDPSPEPFKPLELRLPELEELSPSRKVEKKVLQVVTGSPAQPSKEKKLSLPKSPFSSKSDIPGEQVLKLLDSPEHEARQRRMREFVKSGSVDSAHASSSSSPHESDVELLGNRGDEAKKTGSNRAKCPYCNSPVGENLLLKYSRGGRMNIRQQRAFCMVHKKVDAKEAWKARRYPDIDWEGLDSRCAKHHGFLKDILEGSSCHYGRLLAGDIKSGRNRNVFKAEINFSPGYYGPRGFRAMQENIFNKFSTLLRERAVVDELLAARGYSIYVQSVLAPELAARLVMDDMGVDEKKARDILSDSGWIGELLSDEVEDTVEDTVEDAVDDTSQDETV